MRQIRLTRHIDENECVKRNALAATPREFALAKGSIGSVVEGLDGGKAYLVEFGSRGPDQCDWLGVLYFSEFERIASMEQAA